MSTTLFKLPGSIQLLRTEAWGLPLLISFCHYHIHAISSSYWLFFQTISFHQLLFPLLPFWSRLPSSLTEWPLATKYVLLFLKGKSKYVTHIYKPFHGFWLSLKQYLHSSHGLPGLRLSCPRLFLKAHLPFSQWFPLLQLHLICFFFFLPLKAEFFPT